MKKIMVLVILVLSGVNLHAQFVTDSAAVEMDTLKSSKRSITKSLFSNENNSIAYQVPPIRLPSSPDVASLTKFIEYPVDHSTGVPSINIPIYEIKQGSISLPVTLSYHASGIKVQDVASVVGLGWALNAGGIISRQVLGLNDEAPHGNGPYKSSEEMSKDIYNIDGNSSAQIHLKGLAINNHLGGKWVDSHSDRYLYSVGGYSGVFRFKYGTEEIYTIPYAPIQIKRRKVNNSVTYEIVDPDGVTYIFENKEWIYTNTVNFVSAWRLNKIISANKKDVIELFYTPSEIIRTYSYSETIQTGEEAYYESSAFGSMLSKRDLPRSGSTNSLNQSYLYSLPHNILTRRVYIYNFIKPHMKYSYV